MERDAVADGSLWFGAPVLVLKPVDQDEAAEALQMVREAAEEAQCARLCDLFGRNTGLTDFLSAVFELSPFLRDCARRNPNALEALFDLTINEGMCLGGSAGINIAGAMALAKELTQHSLPEIGDAFGGRDHTTVLHACRKIRELRDVSPDISEDYQNLLRALTT